MAIRDLPETKARALLARLAALRGPAAHAALSLDEIETCVRALEAHLRGMDAAERDARALKLTIEATPSKRLAVYAKAMGFGPDKEMLRQQYPAALVVSFYLTACDESTSAMTEPLWLELADPGVPRRIWKLDQPRTLECAVSVTAARFGFPSLEACRKFLWREHEKIRTDPTGWRSRIDPDFLIPRGK